MTSNKNSTLGFIGTGTIAEALVTGIQAGDRQGRAIILSPRNAVIAKRLAATYSNVAVASNNQQVVDRADTVFLAVTPQVAEEALVPLTFRAEQQIVSLIATFDSTRLEPLVAPAVSISRAAPLPPIARRSGAVALYANSPEIARIFADLGEVVEVAHESEIDILWTATGLMGGYFGMLDTITAWLQAKGISPEDARRYLGALFQALGDTAYAESSKGFAQLAHEHSTPKGLNEQARRELEAVGFMATLDDVMDLLYRRIRGEADLASTLRRRGTHRS